MQCPSLGSGLPFACLALVVGCSSLDEGSSPVAGPGMTGGVRVSSDGGFSIRDSALPDVPVWDPTDDRVDVWDLLPDSSSAEDAGAFGVVEYSPAIDAVDVPLDTRFEITFSKEIDSDWLPTFRLHVEEEDPFAPPIQTHVRAEGATVIAIPDDSLEPGSRYRVGLGRVRSIDGELLYAADYGTEWTFTAAERPGTLLLEGPLDTVVYEPVRERLWGIDREARSLAEIDLAEGQELPRRELLYVPSDLCVSPDGERVYVVNQGSSLLTELDAESGDMLREIPWPAPLEAEEDAHYHVRCSEGRLFVVDASEQRGLWTFDLTQEPPVVEDRSAALAGIGDLVSSPDGSTLYYWSQVTEEQQTSTLVGQLDTSTFDTLQQFEIDSSLPARAPVHAPIFMDTEAGFVVTHDRLIDAADVSVTLFTFDAQLRAVDFTRGRAASSTEVYALGDYRHEADVLMPDAQHAFFDQDGRLHFVLGAPSPKLVTQTFEPDDSP